MQHQNQLFLFFIEIQAWRWRKPRALLQSSTAPFGVWTWTTSDCKRSFKSSILLWHDVTFINEQTLTQQEQMTSRKDTTLLCFHVILLCFAFYVSSFLIYKLNLVCKAAFLSFYHHRNVVNTWGNRCWFWKIFVVLEDFPRLGIQSEHRTSTREHSRMGKRAWLHQDTSCYWGTCLTKPSDWK